MYTGTNQGKGILIVDDNASMRMLLRRIVERKGHEVIGEACNGIEAIELVREFRPTMIMMDYDMDKMDGIRATKIIKKEYPEIKIVMITGKATPSLLQDCMKAGTSTFVIKPFRNEHIALLAGKFDHNHKTLSHGFQPEIPLGAHA
ncbi:MAG TPA: response regulator [bacterium]|nr:response regulator [bacterium]